MLLTRTGMLIDYGLLQTSKKSLSKINKIKKIFSITTIGHNNSRKTIKCHRTLNSHDGKSYLVVPRFAGFMLQKTNVVSSVINKLHTGEPREFKFCDDELTGVKLTENQKVVLRYLDDNIYTQSNIKKGTSSTILQMDPGYGKTYLAMGVIKNLKRKTLIIVPNTYMLRQWVETLTKSFPDNTIGCYYGFKKSDGDIVVSIINSALKYPDYDKCGLVIYDEVHMYCSNKFADIFFKAQAQCCLGLTATPENRIDKFDPVARWGLGDVVFAATIPGWNFNDVKFTTSVTRVLYEGHPDYTKIIESAAGIVSVPLMVNQIQDDPYRNNVIVAYAIHLYNMDRNVFVFSDRRNHLHTLAKLLDDRRISYEAPELHCETQQLTGIHELMGGSTDTDIHNAKTSGRIIMTTYQYSGTGVSINKMNAIILATPRRSNMTQILGRIYRLKSDQSINRNIVDIVDNRICLKSQYYSRKKTYTEILDSNIVDKKIQWRECSDIDGLLLDIVK